MDIWEKLFQALIDGKRCAYLTDDEAYTSTPEWVPVYLKTVDQARGLVEVHPASDTPYEKYRWEAGYIIPDFFGERFREFGVGPLPEPIMVTDFTRLYIPETKE